VLIDRLGSIRPMSELRSGMSVIGADRSGQLVEDTILGWLHKEPGATAEVLLIKTLSGKQLRLTRQHLVYRMHASMRVRDFGMTPFSDLLRHQQTIRQRPELESLALEAVFAEHIRIGDALLDAAAHRADPVVAIDTYVTREGVYAPLTRSGRLVVDGLLVSCYGTYASHEVAHAVLWPARVDVLRTMWGSALGSDSTASIMPYAERLYRIYASAAQILGKARVIVVGAAC
jgi:uncharacterized membrane protein